VSMPHEIDLAVEDARWETEIPGLEALVARAVEAGLAIAPEKPDGPVAVSVLLTDDAAVQELNRTWRGKDKPTNVLTFPAEEPDDMEEAPLLGDIVLALETVRAEAEAEDKTVEAHLAHLVVHGVLHLYGFDHEDPAEAEHMESLERTALARIGIADPYREDAGKLEA
jgi:probable rRNA maturation factor